MNNEAFKFKSGWRVKVKKTGRYGVVLGHMFQDEGMKVSLLVQFLTYSEGQEKTGVFSASEIESAPIHNEPA